jgi:hypothetical protein
MPQNYCRHVNASGVFCQGIPVKNRNYCYWHLHENGRRMKAARARAHSERVIMRLPVLDDLHAVQIGVMQLAEAINHGEIDHRKGRLLLAVLRLAASNLKARAIWEQEAGEQDADLAGYVDEEAGFEKQYGLPDGFDLSVDPEVAFPPAEEQTPGGPHIPAVGVCGKDAASCDDVLRSKLAQVLRDAATPIPGTDFHATAQDMELVDAYEREGEEGGLKRASVLERNRKRREARERRLHYEEMARNRNIQLAAEKLVRDQRKADMAAKAQACAEYRQENEVELNRKPPQSDSFPQGIVATGEGVA